MNPYALGIVSLALLGAHATRTVMTGETADVAERPLVCRPATLTATDTLRITVPPALAGELSIENPRGDFFQLVNRAPTPEMGPQLMTSAALRRQKTLRIPIGSVQGTPYVYGATAAVLVFREPGVYRIRMAKQLNTDDEAPIGMCVVRFRGRS
jgi:hypothetical protein